MNLAEVVRAVLEQVQPDNVDSSAPIVIGEGPEVEIVIVPHRDLDGVSLVAWTDHATARLLWAYVGDLSRHDDIDVGVVVERMRCEGDWYGHMREALVAELRRTIELRTRHGLLGGERVECRIRVNGKATRIGVLRIPKTESSAEAEMTTSLVSGGRPRFSLPPSIRNP